MLYLHAHAQSHQWIEAFRSALPEIRIVGPGDDFEPEQIRWVAAWQPESCLFNQFPHLEAVFALGAGVDAFLNRDDLAAEVPLVRLQDAGMARQMFEYIVWAILRFQRDFDRYAQQQVLAQWMEHDAREAEQVRVGILGLGALGQSVAHRLAKMDYDVAGWKRQPVTLEGIEVFSGDQGLEQLLARSDVLVSLLPDTPSTRGVLNAQTLAQLPQGAVVINVARGAQIEDEALLALLDSGHLRGAVLDVFHEEPLPETHAFWHHPRVVVTPHIAAATLIEPAVRQVAANIQRTLQGRPMDGVVDRDRGY
ncbi:hypothetical protein BFW38_09235 [Terasakiispira papahanaumokuakeensis]|uniref:D-isomer specific 2-hydroxyacid dehydrogenase NAD-binding domain-containing protein n=1 Tax=Terasakiispira papahanaumokuakeensis TaxID=197479 RepID=A0A1E2V9L2_9GAMM|nr:glyoxylate/hydroxypyruvate reductase A [Terasakiispira papahanaumokuakeensis]ODC03698.1 hypothetical protein BFW38_09235 [Terasakiispira papahanaumokuakeensis]